MTNSDSVASFCQGEEIHLSRRNYAASARKRSAPKSALFGN